MYKLNKHYFIERVISVHTQLIEACCIIFELLSHFCNHDDDFDSCSFRLWIVLTWYDCVLWFFHALYQFTMFMSWASQIRTFTNFILNLTLSVFFHMPTDYDTWGLQNQYLHYSFMAETKMKSLEKMKELY